VVELFITLLRPRISVIGQVFQEPASPRSACAGRRGRCSYIAPRRKTADRLRILERLTNGFSVGHIARAEPLAAPRLRQIIVEMLANREMDPPAGFVQFQIARLSEAMIVPRAMMMEGNLQAMGRWIALMGELDCYHGFAAAQILVAPDGGGGVAPRRAGGPPDLTESRPRRSRRKIIRLASP
jgi:hypothetical protein